jgi:CheY-like chemotaxis protein
MVKTVLIVEDSPIQALSLLKLLEKQGVNVICAPNGIAGMALAHKYHPDVIVLDIMLPEMNGLEACRLLKRDPLTADIPIVFLTAHSEAEFLLEGIGGGAIDFIPKDAYSEVVLLGTLRQMGILQSEIKNAKG